VCATLVDEYGGAEKISPRQLIFIRLASYDAARLEEHKRARQGYFKHLTWLAKKQGKNPFDILPRRDPMKLAAIDRCLQPCINSLRENLLALGDPPQGKTTSDLEAYVVEKYGQSDEGKGDADGE
jgi:hypothetical protein